MGMTNEEAIKILRNAIKKPNTKDGYLGQALDMGIKALEQQSSYNSIKTELDHVIDEIIIRIEQTRDKDKLCEYPYNRCINIIREKIKNVN